MEPRRNADQSGSMGPSGRVASSSAESRARASVRLAPHMDSVGRRPVQKDGRSGFPKSAQRRSGNSWTHGIPAGLPCGMPGMGDVMDGAMQQAPHSARQTAGELDGSGGANPGMSRGSVPVDGSRAKLAAARPEAVSFRSGRFGYGFRRWRPRGRASPLPWLRAGTGPNPRKDNRARIRPRRRVRCGPVHGRGRGWPR